MLIRITVEFHDYLRSAAPWPQFPDDPFHDMTYAIDKILINIDSFRTVLHSYGILVGSTRSRIDWNAVGVQSVKDRFLSLYPEFIAETNFENKCRLLLDLFKLQIVFAGAFYDRNLGPSTFLSSSQVNRLSKKQYPDSTEVDYVYGVKK